MIDMGVNCVNLANGENLIDLRNDTVTPETLAKGKTAHNKKGERIVGTGVNADTVDGWHVAVRDDGSAPPSGTINTITFVYGG